VRREEQRTKSIHDRRDLHSNRLLLPHRYTEVGTAVGGSGGEKRGGGGGEEEEVIVGIGGGNGEDKTGRK